MATMKQRQDGAFIDVPHDKGCDGEWVYARENDLMRDRIGRRTSMYGYSWQVVWCIHAWCPAIALVREDAIVGLIPGDDR